MVLQALKLEAATPNPNNGDNGFGVGMEFKAEDNAGTLRLVSRINASLVDASDNTTGTRNGKLQFSTNYHTRNYPRFEILGGANTIVNGSNTFYPSPVLRSTYFSHSTSGITANEPLGSFEFFGYQNLTDGAVGAKIVAKPNGR